ncbi:alpha-2-macroglobulin [Aeromonas hydrophila]|uniref:Alpha-2-macroglobulin n=2 Tax=Aeromonadaceae TaxID=84642 RepID=A0AAX3P9D5_AERHY|nr:alpha-2-macroglobulin [Aeromonas hydrophila]MCV9380755.1 alpha-2-macroglobulin family protein [Aeromonas hydrophila]ONG07248.1 alpha-2-macroglobulin [Aeromonas hydrophila]WEE28046.1 alpha-2-macroglobulin [Aeromonas hydrophila]HDT5864274.1 alpha-2-macroglobulin family protein [Aeromonas hydrophila subsp. hydrophila]
MCQASLIPYPVGYCAALAASQSGMTFMRRVDSHPRFSCSSPQQMTAPGRRWSALLLAGLTALLLSGCGPDKPVANTPTAQTDAQQEAEAPSSVVQANARQYRDAPALALVFSGPLAPKANWQSWLSVSEGGKQVQGEWILADDGRTLYFPNVQPDKSYEVSLKAGLGPSPQRWTLKTRPLEAGASFTASGMVLPLRDELRLPISAVNVDEVNIDFFRVDAEYLPRFLAEYRPGAGMGNWELEQITKRAKRVFSGRYALELDANRRETRLINVKEPQLTEAGVYFAVMSPLGNYDWRKETTYFAVSDMGLSARRYRDQLEVFVSSLASADPLKDVQLSLLDEKGNRLQVQNTDPQGHRRFDQVQGARLLLAEQGNHLAVLRLDGAALDLSTFDLGTQPWQAQQLYLFSGRDLYRPGEQLDSEILLKGQDGQLLPGMAVELEVKQPDGQLLEQKRLLPDSLGAAHYGLRLPDDAPLGRWTINLKTAAGSRFEWPFLVEEFLPERLKLQLGKGQDGEVMDLDAALSLSLQGDYLYGAPASATKAKAEVKISRATMPFTQWQEFTLGDVLLAEQAKDLEPLNLTLDAQGQGTFSLADELDGVRALGPLEVAYRVSLSEPGGRAVNRSRTQYGWPAGSQWPALKADFVAERVEGGKPLPFQILNLDDKGQPQAGAVKVRLINEYRDYYWHYADGEGWKYEFNSQPYLEQEQTLQLDGKGPTPLTLQLAAGWYRLEVENSQGHQSSLRVEIGSYAWGGGGEQARPDKIAITLDKRAYQAGDKAKVTLVAPRPGKGLLLVEDGDGLRWWQRIELKGAGGDAKDARGEFEIPVNPEWQRHDLHISAQIAAPDSASKPAGKQQGQSLRSVGLVPLTLDREARRLPLTLSAPDKAVPLTRLEVTATSTPNSQGRVVLAAVDRGVLNISDYQPLDPFEIFFGRKRFAQDLFDNYGQVIPPQDGKLARLNYGGDRAPLKKGGALESRVEIAALWSGEVSFDEQGKAVIPLDLPNFNGELALMALAWNEQQVGEAERAVKVVAPLVAEVGWPRFGARGDETRALVQLRNMSGEDQTLSLAWTLNGGLKANGELPRTLSLKNGEEQWLTLPLTVTGASGVASLQLAASGKDFAISRDWTLPLRSPWPAETRQRYQMLAPGQQMSFAPAELAGLDRANLQGLLSLSGTPPWDPAAQWQALVDYPYACLEQTLSRAWPYLLTTADERAAWSKPAEGKNAVSEADVQRTLLQRLQRLQLPSGGFGLWDGRSDEEQWLTAYAADYLLARKEAGDTVPEAMLNQALNRLQSYLTDSQYGERWSSAPEHSRLAYQAYSAYVLARVGKAPLATLRLIWEQQADHARSGLPLLHLSLALSAMGDEQNAAKALSRALAIERGDDYLGDYGSPLRDQALELSLLRQHKLAAERWPALSAKVADTLAHRQWLSTQERLALLRLARFDPAVDWQAKVTSSLGSGSLSGSAPLQQGAPEALAASVVTNEGKGSLYVQRTLVGYPEQAPTRLSQGISVTRSWFNSDGQPFDPAKAKVGDLVVVRLNVSSESAVPDALLVEMVPAGFELENPALGNSIKLEELSIEGKPAWQSEWNDYLKHQEFRDDRYTAALDLSEGSNQQLVYLMRAVTPGRYQVPPTQVEDMYRPELRALGEDIHEVTISE